MSFVPVNPRPMLQSLYVAFPTSAAPKTLFREAFRVGEAVNSLGINEEVIIRLKWGQTEYKGQLISVDSYMNVQLNSTEEFINGKSTGTLGQVLIRCNNVLWISAAKGVEMNNDVKMEG